MDFGKYLLQSWLALKKVGERYQRRMPVHFPTYLFVSQFTLSDHCVGQLIFLGSLCCSFFQAKDLKSPKKRMPVFWNAVIKSLRLYLHFTVLLIFLIMPVFSYFVGISLLDANRDLKSNIVLLRTDGEESTFRSDNSPLSDPSRFPFRGCLRSKQKEIQFPSNVRNACTNLLSGILRGFGFHSDQL